MPTIAHVTSIIDLGEEADFVAIAACYECHALLHNERLMTIDERFSKLKKKLSNKYAKPLRVYNMWEESELGDMSDEFAHSIQAGMKLGKEAAERLAFTGLVMPLKKRALRCAKKPKSLM